MNEQLTFLLLVPSFCCRVQWARGQPDGAFGGEDCGELRVMCDFKFNIHFNGLNDFKCSTRIKWICEKML